MAVITGIIVFTGTDEDSEATNYTYELIYNANGGSGAPSTQTAITTSTSTMTFTMRYSVPTYSGYAFIGWSESSTATTATYIPGDSYTFPSGTYSTTLYAVWVSSSSSHTYTLTFDANGGSGGPSAQTSTTTNRYAMFTIPSTVPSRSGYKLVGWSTSSTATTADYCFFDKVVLNSSNTSVTLYAVWSTYVHRIYYAANGGNFASAVASMEDCYGATTTSATTTVTTERPYSALKIFLGWDTSSSATTVVYEAGDSITIPTTTSTSKETISYLYAVWGTPYTYTLTYDDHNGSGGPGTETVTTNTSTYTFTISSTEPTRSNYTFIGWAESTVGYTTLYQAGDSYGPITGAESSTANARLYAIWSPYTFVLTYNSNGGSGSPSSVIVHPTTGSYTFTVDSTTTPTYPGYTFDHWNTAQDDSGTSYDPGDSFTVTGSANTVNTTTLYAQWTATAIYYTYTLSYNANGGSGAPATQTSSSTTSTLHQFNISSTVPTRSGYSFMYWNTESDYSGTNYMSGATITLSYTKTSVTLYAVWGVTYTLSYNANGGSGAPATQSSILDDSSTQCTFTVSSTEPTRSSYFFMGWSTSSSASAATYTAGDSYTATSTTATLYAVWGAYKYVLSYNANGGSGAPSTQTAISNSSSYTFTVSSTVPTNSYADSFAHWNTASDDSGTSYSSGGSITVTGSSGTMVTRPLYAIWSYTYTLTYSGNDSSATSVPSADTQTVITDSCTFTVSSGPSLTGYTFQGWNTESDATGTTYTAGSTFTLTASTGKTATLYAIWTNVYTYQMYYYGNGGNFSGSGTLHTTEQSTATTYGYPITSTVPTRSDGTYEFKGWATSSTGTVAYTYDGTDGTLTYYQLTSASPIGYLWAVWEQGYTYTLTYNLRGGSWTESTTDSHVSFNTSYDFTIPATEPTKDGDHFHGWAVTASSTTRYQAGSTYTVTNPLGASSVSATLVAVWDADYYSYSYHIVYWGNGGTGSPDDVTDYSNSTQYEYTIPGDTTPTRDNYSFSHWNTAQDDSGTSYDPGDTVTITATAATNIVNLYAQWDALYTYVLIYYPKGGDADSVPDREDYTVTDSSYTFTVSGTRPTYSGHAFVGWNTDYTSDTVEYTAGDRIEVEGTGGATVYTYLWAVWQVGYTFTLTYDANGGSGAPETESETTTETTYEFTISEEQPIYFAHSFKGWNTESDGTGTSYNAGDTIEIDYDIDPSVTLYAIWAGMTYWSNEEYNGSVSILFHMDDKIGTYDITGEALLYSYDESSDTKFTLNGYSVIFNLHYSGTTTITATLMDGTTAVSTASKDLGDWSNVIIILDPYEHKVYYTLANQFKSFVNYGTRGTYDLLEWTSILPTETMTVYEICFGTSGTAPRQQVMATSVFLNTYGVVMIDPTFDIDTYWPDMTNIRMNFFSFALYGNDITINGRTFDVDSSKITVQYIVKDSNELYLSKYTDDEGRTHTVTVNGDYTADYDVKEREITLTNFYVTWESGHCYLTFLNDNNWVIDLGTYDNREISMSGMWYFQSGVYESYTVTGTEYVKDWNVLSFDFTFFIIIVLGLLILAGVILRVRSDAKIGDYLIIIGAIAIAITVLGGLAT